MKLISSLSGDGWLQLGSAPASQTRYKIGVWSGPDDVVFGKGHIFGAAEIMRRAMLCRLPIDLVLCCGNLIRIIVTDAGAGGDQAEIYVPNPHPRNERNRAGRPSTAHKVAS